MKPATTIVMIIMIIVSIAHLLRIIFQVKIMANDMNIPIWASIPGFILPTILAAMMWRENNKH